MSSSRPADATPGGNAAANGTTAASRTAATNGTAAAGDRAVTGATPVAAGTPGPAPAAGAPRRRGPAGWPLRTRLLAALMAILAAVCLIIGVLTTFATRTYLIRQLDNQLRDSARQAQRDATPRDAAREFRPDQTCGPGPGFLCGPGFEAGTIGATITSIGAVTAARIPTDYGDRTPIAIPAAAEEALAGLPRDGAARTLDLGDLGKYRVIAQIGLDGTTRVVGLRLREVDETVQGLIMIEIAVTGAGLTIAGLASAVIIRMTLRPLRRVAATASRVAELPLDRGEVALSVRVPATDTDPRTEVGQVGAALNRMLGHIGAALTARQASETRVRQFVADASHELRTPLAAIRGYAELTRRSRDQVPADVAYALQRVESESARMTTLVEDLLLLARLDSGRPLEREPVDLSRLVVDVASDAYAASRDHRWQLDLPDESVTVTGDDARLHQVVANLLANARTHTPAGTLVTTSLAVESDGTVTLRITDNGPGIPESLLPNIFERFARGDSSRSRAAGSTGLGLAIVSAVVEAHHGRVEVSSRPGQTCFAVRLPATPPLSADTQVVPSLDGGR